MKTRDEGDQISRKHRKQEMDWIKRQKEEASNNAAAEIDYSTASWFDLDARKDWDAAAKLEIERRQTS